MGRVLLEVQYSYEVIAKIHLTILYHLGMNNYTEPVFSDNLVGWEAAEAYYHAQELADEAERKRLGIVREMPEEI